MFRTLITTCGEAAHEFWAEALLPTLQSRWKSIGAWTIILAVGIPYAWIGLHRAMAPMLEHFLTHPPETQQQIIQGLYAMPPPLWETLVVNIVTVFSFLWLLKTLWAPFRGDATQAPIRAAFHHEKDAL